jgi:ribosomal protein L11 methyltransferase
LTSKLFRGVELAGEPADEELVAQVAAQIRSRGVEVREPNALARRSGEAPAVRYRIYFPDEPAVPLARQVRALWRQYTGCEPHALTPFVEPDQDWAAASREGFPGTDVGPFWVGPPWLEPPAGRCVIRITPGRAFGTGLHPSTRLALLLMLTRVATAARILDVGTGSGVLGLAALALGAGDVTALDLDHEALRNAGENVAWNGFTGRMYLVTGSLETLAAGCHAFDLVMANIEHEKLLPLLPRILSSLAPDGAIVASGITGEQRSSFLEEASHHGLASVQELQEDGWWGAALKAV